MKTIREILNSLDSDTNVRLMYAFEHSIPQFVELPDGEYIGVHLPKSLNVEPKLTTNNGWSYGVRKTPEKDAP